MSFPLVGKSLRVLHIVADFDLSQHTKHSGKDLGVFDDETKQSYMPHVVECSVGVDRLFLTLLFDAYYEDEVEGDVRVVLKLHPAIAPVTAAILPLSNKLSEQAMRSIMRLKQKGYSVQFDHSGSIGKRYRRQDEIGTPVCFTYDFDSETMMVTVRDRDTLKSRTH